MVERPRSSSSRTVAALTEGHDDEDDEEGVGHGQERVAEGGEDFGDGPQLAEDTQHAAAAQQQDQAQRDADRGEADDGEGDDDEVEDAPGVGDEGTPPVGEEVEEQLGREGDDQDKVDRVQDRPPPGAEGVVGALQAQLRLGDADREVLRGDGVRLVIEKG